ncbi:MAG: hypothetical protein DYG83_13430 [Candidatus Brocadia sp. AMX2]|uniref:Uncharacterized protein n=1 Tax=Candidatus Brocadia sinica JPN1 TaxID=1197129 RepID=A0ABQ0JZ35_9BACT|nr:MULTISPECIES: hypothetical protein [Brocadia]MBC6932248.1 hypothetical protein [Candidatus Brocadia sp.]MBL1168520.1 hypothetical protein [Candidatus Brocadia sp. AMX1]NOG40194.1 hypothetical protein [Planctomycetota bacterium]GIK14246.1 MAG: hypothetical protein BroJett002_29530 [Candidatus Brocadia sinica]KAA0243686.1 MAG: hypothetical protein EDM70_09665 [Candidatus Brocadia sp. AMX2]
MKIRETVNQYNCFGQGDHSLLSLKIGYLMVHVLSGAERKREHNEARAYVPEKKQMYGDILKNG